VPLRLLGDCAIARASDAPEAAEGRRALILVENLSVPLDRRVWQESLTLRRAGYEVVVVCPRGRDRDTEAFVRIDGVEIHRFPLLPSSGGALGFAREYAQAIWRTARLARRLGRTRRFDVVHACNPPDLLLLAALPLKRRGSRFVFDHHDLVPELYLAKFDRGRDLLYRVILLLERLSFGLADVVISTNESYRRVAITRGRMSPSDVFVVRNGPDLGRFRPRPGPDPDPDPDPARNGKRYVIAYVGMMGAQDGIDHALRALAVLYGIRQDWSALFVGDGDVLAKMQRLSEDLGLSESVTFTGLIEQDDVVQVLDGADVCIAPEPSSPLNDVSTMIKIAEYMAMGKPIACYDLPETRFTADGAALYARTGDVDGLAGCLDRLLDDGTMRARLGSTGRARAENVLAWEHSEPQLLAAYERALATGAR
jgi:glycosyltransferase involved in cell wall biosynthesis